MNIAMWSASSSIDLLKTSPPNVIPTPAPPTATSSTLSLDTPASRPTAAAAPAPASAPRPMFDIRARTWPNRPCAYSWASTNASSSSLPLHATSPPITWMLLSWSMCALMLLSPTATVGPRSPNCTPHGCSTPK